VRGQYAVEALPAGGAGEFIGCRRFGGEYAIGRHPVDPLVSQGRDHAVLPDASTALVLLDADHEHFVQRRAAE
jgi:hypothetical protein